MSARAWICMSSLVVLVAWLPMGAAQPQALVVHLRDSPLQIAPARIAAHLGETLRLQVDNAGTGTHDLVVCGDTPSTNSTCNDRWAFTPMLGPGKTANLTFTVAKKGTFEYFCDVPGHKSAGMKGTLGIDVDTPKSSSPMIGLVGGLVALGLGGLRRRR